MAVVINFVGDIGLFRSFELENLDPLDDLALPESDFNIGNFEFIGYDLGIKKKFFDVQEKYFPSTNFLSKIKLDKFHFLGLANNHVMDFGLEGVQQTVKICADKGIQTFGFGDFEDFNVAEIEKNANRIAVIGCIKKGRWSRENDESLGPDEFDLDRLIIYIKKNKKNFNHIIIFPHWGSELVDIPDPSDVQAARKLIDAGATAVIGTHSHIIQGTENYKNGFIAYGLGSFIYRPKEELGFIPNEKRKYSLLVNMTFSRQKLENVELSYYRLDNNSVPKNITEPTKQEKKYFSYLNVNLNNKTLFKRKKYTTLFVREFYSMFIRFRINPKVAFFHYMNYFRRKFNII